MAARLSREVWLNTCGTYGVASAQIYWGRMAALLLRLIYYTFETTWAFVYVDDYIFLLDTETAPAYAMAIIAFLDSIGCPISWKKTCMAPLNHWLGYQINTTINSAILTPDKQTIMINLLDSIIQGRQHTCDEVESHTGRLNWATQICHPMRPFLQPLYAWMMALRNRKTTLLQRPRGTNQAYGRPPNDVVEVSRVIKEILCQAATSHTPCRPATSAHGATDASANETSAIVGGWYSVLPNPDKWDVHWFSIKINIQKHGWAFARETPQQSIAALELYGTLILLKHISHLHKGTARVDIPLKTDNMGNTYMVTNYKAKKWPNSVLLMELALQDHYAGCRADLQHVIRETNVWADDLTHTSHDGFDPKKEFIPDETTWYILHKLLIQDSNIQTKTRRASRTET